MAASIYVCPVCNSTDIYPIYPQSNIWKCSRCGYMGTPQEIRADIQHFWKNYIEMHQKVKS